MDKEKKEFQKVKETKLAKSDRTGKLLLCPECKSALIETGTTDNYRYCECRNCGVSGTWLK
jgi:hypothetical protein